MPGISPDVAQFDVAEARPSPEQSADLQRKIADVSSGGKVDYYVALVRFPQRTKVPYTAECEDIIEALEMTFDEGNIFKEIWRTAKARQGVVKEGHTTVRAAQKLVHYAKRILRRAELNSKAYPQ